LKLTPVRRFALFIGTFLAALQLMIFIGLFFDKHNIELLESDTYPRMYLFVIPTLLMTITWKYNRVGAIFLIIIPILFLFLPEEYGQFENWLQLSAPFIIIGLMLLNYFIYNKYLDRRTLK
jgi:hypothetical protein